MLAHVCGAELADDVRTSPLMATNGDERRRTATASRPTRHARGSSASSTGTEVSDREASWLIGHAPRRVAWHECHHSFEVEDCSTSG
jgi:hypothetical protein